MVDEHAVCWLAIKLADHSYRAGVLAAVVLCWMTGLPQPREAQAASYQMLYSFPNPTFCCGNIYSFAPWTLLAGPDGALYGSYPTGVVNGVNKYGTIFRLAPPAKSATGWHYSTVFEFGATTHEGRFPSGFAFDRSGALYGTTSNGGLHDLGTIFKLTAPNVGYAPWRREVLTDQLSFAEAAQPSGRIYVNSSGAVFGTVSEAPNSYGGAVYQLAPSTTIEGKYVLHILHGFSDVEAFLPHGVTLGRDHALYGVSNYFWRLTPPSGAAQAWTYQALLDPDQMDNGSSAPAGLSVDRSLNIFSASSSGGKPNPHGGGSGNGFIFELIPPVAGQTPWTRRILYEFGDGEDGRTPSGSITEGPDGVLYGMAQNDQSVCLNDRKQQVTCGLVFKLVPRGLGKTVPWDLTVLHAFGARSEGSGSVTNLVYMVLPDGTAGLFGTTSDGGAYGYGTVFEIVP